MYTKDQHIKLGNRIRLLLIEAGISQQELAKTIKVGPNQVSRWVVGAVAPTYTVLVDILKICNLEQSAEWLLTGKGESPIKDKGQGQKRGEIILATKKPDKKKLGTRIKHVMSLSEELQKTIAKKAGCQPTEISRWVRGEVAPSYHKLAAIGRVLELNGDEIAWLFDGKGQAPGYPGYKELDENCENEVKEAEGPSDKADQKPRTEKDKPSMDLLETKDKLISNLEDTATSEPDTKNEFIKTLKEFNVHLREENTELKKEIIALRGG